MSDPRGTNIPIPDPSLLTTEQFIRGQDMQRRELGALREYLSSEMNRIERVHEEKFKSLETRFTESKSDEKMARETALKVLSEANEKTEKNFTKQIEANESQTKTITGALNSQLTDLKERFLSSEGKSSGSADNTARLMAGAMFVIALGMAIYTVTLTHGGNQPPTIVSPAVIPVQPSNK